MIATCAPVFTLPLRSRTPGCANDTMNDLSSHEANQTRADRRSPLAVLAVLLSCVAVLLLSGCESPSGSYRAGAGNFDTIVVDAGHGGHDSGAKACFGKNEKFVTLDTARRLAKVLRSKGFRVIETRTDDYFVTLGGRVAVSNRLGNAIFVSVHYNWVRGSHGHGIETYYFSPRSARLAANIQREVTRVYRTDNRGIKQRGFYVLRNNRRPAVLCELGFVSSPSDNAAIQNPAIRQQLAERIAAGIIAEKLGRIP